ncbi:28S ribosomal protein S31, mitochondrial [Rhopalosiphum maidis]|uniref:28S ribosomal protein S31, mitochondrial n=1 Tax=Rhopalosiphum maidis TaxID=43146 RepID=UPI000F004463|nr:28S ribosomal protein S31, mitochondrial [Rhopalosiphum maidis]
MNPTLSIKCIPYINGSKRNTIRGVFCLTQRYKSDDDNNSKKNQSAVEKLNNLLKTMKKGNDTNMIPQESKPIDLAQPRQLARKAEQNKQDIDESKHNKPLGEKLSDAATKVAQSIGGDTNKTKSDLLNLLRIYNNEPNDSSEKKVKSSVQLDDLLSGMKIDRSQPKNVSLKFSDVDRAQRVRELIGHGSGDHQRTKKYKRPMDNYVPISLFSSDPLGIFKEFNKNKDIPILPTWKRLHEKSLQTAVTHPPKNIYEQMIIWTEQGKLWKFPINNEQGMNDEHNVFFAEHVFLEPLIDEWCPKKGPIRHFMELVCVGLSKNPFLSVEEKKDHINWFRQYFYAKNQLLNEIGAFEIKSLPENVKEYYKPTIPDK